MVGLLAPSRERGAKEDGHRGVKRGRPPRADGVKGAARSNHPHDNEEPVSDEDDVVYTGCTMEPSDRTKRPKQKASARGAGQRSAEGSAGPSAAARSKAGETSMQLDEDDGHGESAFEAEAAGFYDGLETGDLARLESTLYNQYGWTWKNGNNTCDWRYLRPHARDRSIKGLRRGVDFFCSMEEVKDFVDAWKRREWRPPQSGPEPSGAAASRKPTRVSSGSGKLPPGGGAGAVDGEPRASSGGRPQQQQQHQGQAAAAAKRQPMVGRDETAVVTQKKAAVQGGGGKQAARGVGQGRDEAPHSLEEAKRSMQRLQAELAAAKKTAAEREQEVRGLQGRIKPLEKELEGLRSKVGKQAAASGLERRCTDAEKRVGTLTRRVAELEKREAAAKKEAQQHRDEREAVQQQLRAEEERRKVEEEQREKAEQQLKQARQENESLDHQLINRVAALEAAEASKNQLTNQLETARARVKSLKGEKQELADTLKAKKSKIQQLKEDQEALEEQLSAKADELMARTKEANTARAAQTAMTAELKKARAKMQGLGAEKESLQQQVQSEQHRNRELLEQAQKLVQQLEEARGALEPLQQQLGAERAEAKRRAEELSQLKSKQADLLAERDASVQGEAYWRQMWRSLKAETAYRQAGAGGTGPPQGGGEEGPDDAVLNRLASENMRYLEDRSRCLKLLVQLAAGDRDMDPTALEAFLTYTGVNEDDEELKAAMKASPKYGKVTKRHLEAVALKMEELLRDATFNPFIKRAGHIEGVDEQNEQLKNFEEEHGTPLRDLLVSRLTRMEKVNPSGRYPEYLLWDVERDEPVASVCQVLEQLLPERPDEEEEEEDEE